MSPFPLVRMAGSLTRRGVRVRVLAVRAPHGSLVRVRVKPGCRRGVKAKRCRAKRSGARVGKKHVVRFKSLSRPYRFGTIIEVRVWRAGQVGKYTRFVIRRGKAPKRIDQCLRPGAMRGSRCPAA
jgi:hypothetical protein